MKFNIGGGPKKIEGYENIDALPWDGATDFVFDVTAQPWSFAPLNSSEEILMCEFLEHISFRKTDFVLRQAHALLKPGGRLIIQVPDCGAMMRAYCNDKINSIIPHKPESVEQVKELRAETGFVVHPNRWLFAFLGAQKHEFDYHRNIFTKERLEEYLENAGFSQINFLNDPLEWKIKAVAIK